jgi:hypothetical protein
MKKSILISLVVLMIVMGCSKPENVLNANPDENQLKSARTATTIGTLVDNGVFNTGLFLPPATYNYQYVKWSDYGLASYDPSQYDVMVHFKYISQVAVNGAVIEFTFPHIKYFVPHITNPSEERAYTVNNTANQTVISCISDLKPDKKTGMFCFIVKVDCGKGQNGFSTLWTDVKINGVSAKGTLENKTWKCN